MTFLGLIVHNLCTKRLRTVLTSLAVAIGVLTVVTLSVVTQSLRGSAAAVLPTGTADFTVAQKSVDGALNSVSTTLRSRGCSPLRASPRPWARSWSSPT